MEIPKFKEFKEYDGTKKIEAYLDLLTELYVKNREALDLASEYNASKKVIEDLEYRDAYLENLLKIVENILNEKIIKGVSSASMEVKIDYIKELYSQEIQRKPKKEKDIGEIKKDICCFEQGCVQEKESWPIIYKMKEADIFFNKYLTVDEFINGLFRDEVDIDVEIESFKHPSDMVLFQEMLDDYRKIYQSVTSDDLRVEVINNFKNDEKIIKSIDVQKIFSDLYYYFFVNNKFFKAADLSATSLSEIASIREELRENYDKVSNCQDIRSIEERKYGNKRKKLVYQESEAKKIEHLIDEYKEILAKPGDYLESLDEKVSKSLYDALENDGDIRNYEDLVRIFQEYQSRKEKLLSDVEETKNRVENTKERIAIISELKDSDKFRKDLLRADARKKRIGYKSEYCSLLTTKKLFPNENVSMAVKEALKCEEMRCSQLKLIADYLKIMAVNSENIDKREELKPTSLSKMIENKIKIRGLKKLYDLSLRNCFKSLKESNLVDIYPADNPFYDKKNVEYADINNYSKFFKKSFISFNNFILQSKIFYIGEDEKNLREFLMRLSADISDLFRRLSQNDVVSNYEVQKLDDIIKRQLEFINYLRNLDKELTFDDESADLSEYFSKEFVEKCRGIIDLAEVDSGELTDLLYNEKMKLASANLVVSSPNYILEDLEEEVLGLSEESYQSILDLLEGIESERVAVETIEDNIKKLSI